MKRVHLMISGRVQGVGYRMYVRDVASRCQVSGWVRNLPDGRVEAVGEGEPDAVDRFAEGIRARDEYIIRVDRVETRNEGPEGLTGFEIRR